MSNEANPSVSSGPGASTGGPPARTSTASGATKVFREFKWGLLTLFLLMVVVIGLVYDGGRRKEAAQKPAPKVEEKTAPAADGGLAGLPTQGQPPGLPGGPAYTDDYALGNTGRITDALGQPGTRPVTPAPQPDRNLRTPELPTGVPSTGPRNRTDTTAGQTGAPRNSVAPKPDGGGTETAASEYKVQSGDTLEGIARKLFPGRVQTGVRLLCEANQISDPRRIQIGQTLKVPTLPAEKKAEAAKTEGLRVTTGEPSTDPGKPAKTEAAAGEEHVYLVQAGDTLERIARRVLKDGSRWREIYEWNRDQIPDPHILQVGQKLKVKGAESAAPEASQEAQPAKVIKNPKLAQNDEAEKGKEKDKSAKPVSLEHSETVQRWMP